jgi:hypothetical protein
MTAAGDPIHFHPSRRGGLRPNDQSKPRLYLRSTAAVRDVPQHPLAADLMDGVRLAMDLNDRAGTCVPTGFDHFRRMATLLLTGTAVEASEGDVVRWYRTQNPGFDPNASADTNGPGSSADQGMIIQDFLDWLTRQGLILGFAAISPADDEMLKSAAWLGMGPINGLTLTEAQVSGQFDNGVWDEIPSMPSPVVGGHCVPTGAYTAADAAEEDCASWKKRVHMTRRFLDARRDEAWAVILNEHVDHAGFRAGFDLAAFATAFERITGRPFPVHVTPDPIAPPAPPGPRPFSFSSLWRTLLRWIGGLLGRG